jgi:hypothetical protein
MNKMLVYLTCAIVLLCCPFAKAEDKLTTDDVNFLKSCNIEQADIDVIPKLPAGGKENIQLVLESKHKHCNMEIIKSFKATREYLKKFTPIPELIPPPPRGYTRDYLTKEEQNYMIVTNNNIIQKQLDKNFNNK